MGKKDGVVRIISGKGILKVPISTEGYRYLSVSCEVIRESTNPYANFNYSPIRQQHAFLTFLQDGFVVDVVRHEFEKQRFIKLPDITGEVVKEILCEHRSTLKSFVNLARGLGGQFITENNPIKDYAPIDLGFDAIQVVCYADTAISVSCNWEEYDVCVIEGDPPDKPNPPSKPNSPEPPNKYKPGEPIPYNTPGGISPAYDGSNDSGNTVPHPIDKISPPNSGNKFPFGTKCQKVKLTFDLVASGFRTDIRRVVTVFGEFTGQIVPYRLDSPVGASVGVTIECRGIADFNPSCQDLGIYKYEVIAGGLGTEVKIDSVNLISYEVLP